MPRRCRCIRLIIRTWKNGLKYRLRPTKDYYYHVYITRSIHHCAYARQTQLSGRKEQSTTPYSRGRVLFLVTLFFLCHYFAVKAIYATLQVSSFEGNIYHAWRRTKYRSRKVSRGDLRIGIKPGDHRSFVAAKRFCSLLVQHTRG